MALSSSKKEKVVYILPSLKVGGVETAISLAYPALSSKLDIEYIILDADGANPQFAPSSRLTAGVLCRLIAKRREYILVSSLWRAHLVGLFLRFTGVHWVAFFHNAVQSGNPVDRVVCRISTWTATTCFFDSKRTQFEFENRAKKKLGIVIPFLFNKSPNTNAATPTREIDLIFVGRYVDEKRIDLCLQLLKLCILKKENFRMAFVGYGVRENLINNFAVNFSSNVQNYGLLPNQAVRVMLQKAKMILCLSEAEGMAMAVIEGIQEGCVPVVRLTGELNNYLDENSALIQHPAQSLDELSKKLVLLTENPNRLATLNQKAKENIRQYSDYTSAFLSAIASIAVERQKNCCGRGPDARNGGQCDTSDSPGYNERLFGSGFRKWLHEARFLWLQRTCRVMNLNTESVLELGCFDARSIFYLPNKPKRYYGFDANWEGGLDLARKNFGSEEQYKFITAARPEALEIVGRRVSLALSLETMEHIAPELVGGYLRSISGLLDGYFIVTVPNEKGLLFLAKYLVKKLVVGGAYDYTFFEALNASLGRMDRVARNDHKGFDWEKLLGELKLYFDVKKVEGIQFPWAPLCCNAQIGFVLHSRALAR